MVEKSHKQEGGKPNTFELILFKTSKQVQCNGCSRCSKNFDIPKKVQEWNT